MKIDEALSGQLATAQVALICWLDADGGAHFVGSGTDQPLSRLKVIGLLESSKMMIQQQILEASQAAASAAEDGSAQ